MTRRDVFRNAHSSKDSFGADGVVKQLDDNNCTVNGFPSEEESWQDRPVCSSAVPHVAVDCAVLVLAEGPQLDRTLQHSCVVKSTKCLRSSVIVSEFIAKGNDGMLMILSFCRAECKTDEGFIWVFVDETGDAESGRSFSEGSEVVTMIGSDVCLVAPASASRAAE
ncbi:hypothetical protein F2P81_012312 [Scophthalmus maximus]|uniref:Uncharacterized protein n=1 Tax=Scophthalmus maximus TaxID=52904 RepID=A0A6A4SU32_SCOMX|nr:hypothetical protein F2P81_012312 [Scophthalmus maximus]